MTISRRAFFVKAGLGAVEDALGRLGGVGGEQSRVRPGSPGSEERWIEIGGIRDYPAGTRREFSQWGFWVDSDAAGLVARDPDGRARPARIDGFGRIWVDSEGQWPDGAFLSWATGEMATSGVQVIEATERA